MEFSIIILIFFNPSLNQALSFIFYKINFSQHGKTQEVEIHLGVRMQLPVVMDIVNYSNFLEASYPSICCRGT